MSEEAAPPSPSAEERRRRQARLANIRQGLLAPVNAIAGYADILHEEACRLELRDVLPDLERVSASAEALLTLVGDLLDVGAAAANGADRDAGDDATATFQQRLRHDLRNPLNAIVGYGEMLLEDTGGAADGALRQDLERLLAEASRLVASLDEIVDFSGRAETEDDGDPASAMIADLLRTVRPLAPEDARRSRETGTVLVVDDNPSNRELLLRRLAREGHRALEAALGRMALQILEVEEVDVILLDLLMPELNGYEVLARLKGDERWREIPVIMISGLREIDSVVRCIEAGADDYLPKPFDPVLLRARIAGCLERKRWHDRERRYLAELAAEKARADALLHNILPREIVSRLGNGELMIADRVEEATILFCDLVGFTELAAALPPARLIERLNGVFSEFDQLARELGIEKIKTIGDAYMAAAGLPLPREDHAAAMAEMALGMLDALERQNATVRRPFRARIGMHTGPVVAGIIGRHKFTYDVWGDTVNLAHRLEAQGVPGRIQVSAATRDALAGHYAFEPRGLVDIRGKGQVPTYLLLGRNPAR